MDRSSFSFKGSTNDLEKRLAFKARLARKIEPSEKPELSVVDNTFNGVSPGGALIHPTLGEGTLVEINHGKNEIVIDFASKGLVALVLSQAKTVVHPPRKNVTPHFTDPESKFFAPGTAVWHPDLGACTILSVNEKKNNVTLETPRNGKVDLVLSQVKPKLRAINTVQEHVPNKPLVKEPLGKQVTQYKARGEVSVSLPSVFKDWRRNQQFMFLTRTQSLTTEQANDVFSVLDGKKPLFHTVSIGWETEEETKSKVIPVPAELSSESKSSETVLSIMQEKNLWHPDFGECSVASADVKKNELILMTSVGLVPFVLDVTIPKLAVLTTPVEHTPKKIGTRVLSTTEPKEKEKAFVSVTLPEAFTLWKTSDQYIFLTKTAHLTPECANDIIDSVAGRLNNSKTEYEIIWE